MPSSTITENSLYTHASALLEWLSSSYDDQYGVGTFTPSIYDTAWVSMVYKPNEGWAFPESFQYICDTQHENGSWPGNGDMEDCVMNTIACLLSIKLHQKKPGAPVDIEDRADRAIRYLEGALLLWNVEATERIAFEMVVPRMLDLLESEGVAFRFPGRNLLNTVSEKKMAKIKFSPAILQTTVAHSLEAFVGKWNFDEIKKTTNNGSMMASPSSTAAYLIGSSTWDEEAERYLRKVISRLEHYGPGAVPNCSPTTSFEFSWSLCNLLQNGFELSKLPQHHVQKLGSVLKSTLDKQGGVTGWAAHVIPDADDTGKALNALSLIGDASSSLGLIQTFEKETHFQCFAHERNVSVSANCNVLLAFVHAPDPGQWISQIEKCAKFLVDQWWTSNMEFDDKWHTSPYYLSMLSAQGLVRWLHLLDSVAAVDLTNDLYTRLPVVLFQIALQIIDGQNEDGSWGKSHGREETSYGIIALANLISAPWIAVLSDEINTAISRGRQFLISINATHDRKLAESDNIWIGKVTYAVESVAQSYVLGALGVPVPTYTSMSAAIQQSAKIPQDIVKRFTGFYARLPTYANLSPTRLRAFLWENYLFLPELAKHRFAVFDRKGVQDDKYFAYLPFTWSAVCHMFNTPVSNQVLFSMMVISMINFQADEYLDGLVIHHGPEAIAILRNVVNSLFDSSRKAPIAGEEEKGYWKDVHTTLARYCDFILDYPAISHASDYDKIVLKTELRRYLLAQVDQCEDNIRYQVQDDLSIYRTPPTSYHKWVRTTSSEHTSTHISFAFMLCHLGRNGQDALPSPHAKYLALDCMCHSAITVRIFNDYGSLKRDREEKNLSSFAFPEFEKSKQDDNEIKKWLKQKADYEYRCLDNALAELKQECTPEYVDVYEAVHFFCRTATVYNEIYEVRDISSGH